MKGIRKGLIVSLIVVVSLFFGSQAFAQTATATVTDVTATAGSLQGQQIVGPLFVSPDEQTIHQTGVRSFGYPQNLITPPGFVGNIDTGNGPGSMFLDILTILQLKNVYTYDECRKANNSLTGTEVVPVMFVDKTNNSSSAVTFLVPTKKGEEWIMPALPKDAKFVGYTFAVATKMGRPSPEILADAVRSMVDYGVNLAVPISQGFDKEMFGSAWTASAGMTGFNMSSKEQSMGTAGIGIGYGEGQTGMKSLPFLKAACYIVPPPPAPKPAEKKVEAPVEKKAEAPATTTAKGDLPWYKKSTLMD